MIPYNKGEGVAILSTVVSRDIIYSYHCRPGGSNIKMVMPRKNSLAALMRLRLRSQSV